MFPRLRLGELLLEEQRIDEQQLERALRAQAELGGRLGTNLVELDLISVLDLGAALSRQRGIPEASPRDFMAASPRLLAQFPRELAAKHGVFPLRVHNGMLQLAMMDPQDADQISEITLVTGLRVIPLVSPQLRMLFFLEQRFGIPRPARFCTASAGGPAASQTGPLPRIPTPRGDPTGPAILAPEPALEDKSSATTRRRERGTTRVGVGIVSGAILPADSDENPDLVYLDDVSRQSSTGGDDFEVTVEPGFEAAPEASSGDAPVAEPAPAAATSSAPVAKTSQAAAADGGELPEGLEAVRTALASVHERSQVAALAVRPVLPYQSLNVLFRVQKEMAVALAAAPTSIPVAEVERLELPLAADSLLQRAIKSCELVRAPGSSDPLQKVISAYLRRPEPGEVCVMPVLVARRVVSLLCVQLPAGVVAEDKEIAKLPELAMALASTYVRLIREAKASDKSKAD